MEGAELRGARGDEDMSGEVGEGTLDRRVHGEDAEIGEHHAGGEVSGKGLKMLWVCVIVERKKRCVRRGL